MEQTMIKTENVSKRFGSFALQDIHFELPAGYICGLIGENGVGKTTLLNILAGLYEYDGTISIQEKEYRTNQMELQQDIGFVFHEEWFDDWDSLIANSRHYGKYYKNYDETLLKEYLKRFRLDGKKKYKKLSKGEKLKFAFAFALAHHPKLLLLDEPGANFDQTFREEFHHILREFTADGTKSVILSTHITSDVDRFADYLLLLKKGRQLLYGDIESIRDAYRMVAGERHALRAFVELPDLKGREEILKVHAKKVALAPGIDFNTVARMASGASGAELANIVNEAALRAVRAGRKSVTQADLEESIEVVIAGYQKKNSILTDKEKCIVAYHEIGHALVAAKQSNSAPVQKITIIPRTSGALGYTMQVDEGNHYLMSKEELENKIATLTGGRAAEEVVFRSITTGASNDIEQATKLARAMLTRYGMSKDFDMVALETVNNQYLGGDTSLACSAQTQREIDQKVVELVKAQHEKAVQILTDNRAKLDELAQYLYQKETITGEEFMEILNREPAQAQ